MPITDEGQTLVKSVRERCEKHMEEASEEPYLKKCLQRCDVLLGMNSSDDASNKWLKLYTEAVLDLTYFEENQLVQSDFNEENAEQNLQQFIDTLSQPEELLQKWHKEAEPVSVLGEEIWECILWRKGALMYMYCATCMEQQGRPQRHLEHFIQCAREGVRYLQDMLRVRGPLQLAREQVSTNDESTFKLLLKGVYTDTHVLALMYAGELCHWFETLATSQLATNHDDFDPYTTGTHMLRTYIDVVIGPLKGQGWSTQRAQDLLMLLKTDQCSTQLKQSTI